MTSNLALGANTAIESVASLANHLHAILQASPDAKPTTAEWETTFASFQKQRKGRAASAVTMTGDYTRRATWATTLGWFLQMYLGPWLGDQFVMSWVFSPFIKDGTKLDFVEEKHRKPGKVAWTDDNVKR
jgi:2-polyprenyl-6-methoxyphenol hydroxylase-like FAD-dependent oxidoreductase